MLPKSAWICIKSFRGKQEFLSQKWRQWNHIQQLTILHHLPNPDIWDLLLTLSSPLALLTQHILHESHPLTFSLYWWHQAHWQHGPGCILWSNHLLNKNCWLNNKAIWDNSWTANGKCMSAWGQIKSRKYWDVVLLSELCTKGKVDIVANHVWGREVTGCRSLWRLNENTGLILSYSQFTIKVHFILCIYVIMHSFKSLLIYKLYSVKIKCIIQQRSPKCTVRNMCKTIGFYTTSEEEIDFFHSMGRQVRFCFDSCFLCGLMCRSCTLGHERFQSFRWQSHAEDLRYVCDTEETFPLN